MGPLDQSVRRRRIGFASQRGIAHKAYGVRQYLVITLRCHSWSLGHYVVEVIDHRYQHALDLVIHLLDDLVTALRPNDGRKPE